MGKINQRDAQDRRHGVWEYYRSDGTLEWRRHYVNGKRHGVWESYSSDGTLWSRGHYHHDKQHGVWEWYLPDGTLWGRAHYHYGILKGLEKFRDSRGIPNDKTYHLVIK
jgi:antitoxin component YwqK of YwqJK toxin-antitoxin module